MDQLNNLESAATFRQKLNDNFDEAAEHIAEEGNVHNLTAAQLRQILGVSTLTGDNTGDQDLSGYATLAALESSGGGGGAGASRLPDQMIEMISVASSSITFLFVSTATHVAVQWWDNTISVVATPTQTLFSVSKAVPIGATAWAGATPKTIRVWPCTGASDLRVAGTIWSLRVSGLALTQLDVTKATGLLGLECWNNLLQELDVSKSTDLQYLACNSNSIQKLDITELPALQTLYCQGNSIKSLDFSANVSNLGTVACYTNPIVALDFSGAVNLSELECGSSALTALNLSGCDGLQVLHINGSSNLTGTLNISNLTQLTRFSAAGLGVDTLNISGLTELHSLNVSSSQSLSAIVATGVDGAAYYHPYTPSQYQINLSDCNLTTDAVYSMLSQMVAADPSPSWINLQGNPCDAGGGQGLTDGVDHSAFDTVQLAATKGYTLILS